MAEAVAAAIRGRRHLIVEAGTGVGKSFAYLAPGDSRSHQRAEGYTFNRRGKDDDEDEVEEADNKPAFPRIVVSARSPFRSNNRRRRRCCNVMPQEFTAVLVKGRGVLAAPSLRRDGTSHAQPFEQPIYEQAEFDQLRETGELVEKTGDVAAGDLEFRPAPDRLQD